ncbi:sulfhydryl oxidase 1 [Rhineura floridana]|uniref:sulfhydryl oxidase 1 n=1 Tax=Rhineura floridana TaxID=261503 RepID=UPI002AC7FFEB|nr:sulfhydryl oxidase 1 [Rhineura floridana]
MPRRLSRARPGLLAPPACVFLSSFFLLLVPMPGALSLGLYSPDDPLVLLSADTLERSVLNSSSAWVVEFYASWCGHCIQFSPTWKALANDIKDWRPAVMLGVVDCAEMTSQKICSEFGITGYPTLKFYKAFSKKPEDGIRLYHHGDDIRSLRESIITSVERHEGVWPPACPPLQPISAAELHGFFHTKNVTYLALIFEKDDSFLGREVTLDMLQYENIAVRRVIKSNEELVKSFNVTTFPSGFLLVKNGSCSSIPVHVDSRPLYTDFLKRLPGVFKGDSFKPTVPPSVGPLTTPVPWRVADRKKLYMADVESAVLYTLRMEAARFLSLDKERLSALKQYVAVLVKYFPGRLMVMNYLRNVDSWLRPKTNVSQSEWKEALRNKNELPNAWLPENPTWVGCQGSKPRFRGYPCGLWTLFHLLTVQEALRSPRYASPSEVLPTMRGYIQYFFGCRECADHFEGMAAESMNKVRNKDGAVLWLWSRHNRVNARLAGTASDDPKFPKIQWPPQDLCWSCQITINGRRMWDERAILMFFKRHFSRGNIYLDFLKPERGHLVRQGRDVEERGYEAEGKLEEWGGGQQNGRGGEEEEFEEDKNRTEKPESGRTEKKKSGLERSGSPEVHKPSIVKMSTKTKELEENIVDLDNFSEHHYKSKALKTASEASSRHRRSKRDAGLVLMEDESDQSLNYDAVWGRLRQKGIGAQQLIGAMEEEEEVDKEGRITLRRSQWLHILGAGFSRLDVSLCIVLYFLSSMCLLGMYTFFRMRMRYRKGRLGFPSA